jgi:hypothetical protein
VTRDIIMRWGSQLVQETYREERGCDKRHNNEMGFTAGSRNIPGRNGLCKVIVLTNKT